MLLAMISWAVLMCSISFVFRACQQVLGRHAIETIQRPRDK
jgi:hypothetical protein